MISVVAAADDHHHLIERRERLVAERIRLAAERERLGELRQNVESASRRSAQMRERMLHNRLNAAYLADQVADQAEAFAALLEARATGQARSRRLRLAQREREIAAIERRNATRLRQAGPGPVQLEHLPPLNDTPEEF